MNLDKVLEELKNSTRLLDRSAFPSDREQAEVNKRLIEDIEGAS